MRTINRHHYVCNTLCFLDTLSATVSSSVTFGSFGRSDDDFLAVLLKLNYVTDDGATFWSGITVKGALSDGIAAGPSERLEEK